MLLVVVDSLGHLAELDVEIEAKSICALFLAGLDIYRLYWGQIHCKQTFVDQILVKSAAQLVRLEQLSTAMALLHEMHVLLLLGCYLGVVLEDALALVGPFEVLASDALAVGITGNAGLEAFAVLLQALALLAVAALGVPLLAAFADDVGGRQTRVVSLGIVRLVGGMRGRLLILIHFNCINFRLSGPSQ